MVVTGSLQMSQGLGLCKSRRYHSKQFKRGLGRPELEFCGSTLSSRVSVLQFRRKDSWNVHVSDIVQRPIHSLSYRHNAFKCYSFLQSGVPFELPKLKTAAVGLTKSVQGNPIATKLAIAAGITSFAAWGVMPLIRIIRNLILHKNDKGWKNSNTYYIITSYLQPMLLWTGAILICRALEPVALPTETSQVVKQRLLTFVGSLSTVLAFAYCLSSVIQQTQKFFMENNSDPSDTRNMGFQFAGKAVYSAVWIAAFSLFMELLGFSTQKWVTAGGLGTVLLTLAGREIFTNFLSSAMIHATRPFVVNEWIQTKIEGYEVSGTVEHVGWWSPTIIRGENREAVHIPNHKFTVNVVRNLTQKTHWRIKTHLAISHLDMHKINNIVADMRKVLAKNPQVEQQKLHRRVFLENVNSENQALMILISCFVKTSHFEEYLCVKEAILLDLLRVISHHRARLATPIRTVQKIFTGDAPDLENIPFADSVYNRSSNRPLLLIEPSYKVNCDDHKTKTRSPKDSKINPTAKTKPESDPVNGSSPPPPQPSSSDSPNQKAQNGKQAKSSGVGGSGNQKSASPEVSKSKAAVIEENIVLGVALEGSKRTLPIEEEGKDLTSSEITEMAGRVNNQSVSDKDSKKDKDGGQTG